METKTARAAAGRSARAGSAGPAFLDVARHAFKLYDDDGRVYCVSCDRVLAPATAAHLEAHHRTCGRGASGPTGGARTYACGACDVTARDPDLWAHHLGTAGHWRRCAAPSRSAGRGTRYAYACAGCDVTLYDTEDAIERHASRRHRGAGGGITEDERFVAVVHAALASSRAGGGGGGEDAVHCCVGCHAVDAGPVHAELRPRCGGGGGPAETFYCGACRVTIVCDAPTYDRLHRAAPEHAAMAAVAARDEDDEDEDEDDCRAVPRMARTLVLGTRRRLGGDDDDHHCRACRLCGDRLPSRPDAVSLHVPRCPALLAQGQRLEWSTLPPPPAGKSRADYDAFRCGVCRVTVADPAAWSRHLSTAVAAHAVTPQRMAARAYYECAPCRTLYYGPRDRPRDDADGPLCADGPEHRYRPVGPVADLMRYVYRDVNSAAADDDDDDDGGSYYDDDDGGSSYGDDCGSSYGSRSRRRRRHCYYYAQNTGRYGRCDRSAEPAAVPFYCPTCRLEFYGDRAAFRQHALTVEHALVRLFATARPTARARHAVTPVYECAPAHVTGGDGWTAAGPPDVGSPGLDAVATIRGGGGHAFAWPDFREPHETSEPDSS